MRRAVLTLGGTVAGLAALFSYKTHAPSLTQIAAPSTPAGLSMSAPSMTPSSPSPAATKKKTTPKPSASPAAPTMTATAAPPPTTPAPPPSTPAPPPSTPAGKSGTFAGPQVDTQYGPVQVTITETNGKITNANGVAQGDGIAVNAMPQLNSEVIAAQSANIQAVSGATYTSQGYLQSLQAALNKAG